MHHRAPVRRVPSRQLSFSDAIFSAEHSAQPSASMRAAALAPRPETAQLDTAVHAPSNAYELRAGLRNSLTALSTATALLIRHAPDSKMVGELSAVMLRQIDFLAQQIQKLEGIAAHCEAAEI